MRKDHIYDDCRSFDHNLYKNCNYNKKINYNYGLDILIPSVLDRCVYKEEIPVRIKYINMLSKFKTMRVKRLLKKLLNNKDTPRNIKNEIKRRICFVFLVIINLFLSFFIKIPIKNPIGPDKNKRPPFM